MALSTAHFIDIAAKHLIKAKTTLKWLYEAYTEHGYNMQQIANYTGLHHSTVSKKIKQGEKVPRIKT